MGRILAVWVWLSLALAVPVTFRYTPPSGLEVRSVSLRGSFNSWGETPMQKEDGSWAVTVDLDPGEHQYKFFINGQWPRDMCNDPTFGTPMVDPKAAGCVDDGFGGQNAVIVVQAPVAPTPPAGPVALDFTHDPLDAQYVSHADGKLSVRFRAGEGAVAAAWVEVQGKRLPMHLQLSFPGSEVWRGTLPGGVGAYRILVRTQDGKEEVFGPFNPPERPFAEVAWVGEGVGYQIFPERFYNGDSSNDALALETDEYRFNQVWQRSSGPKPHLSRWGDPPSPLHCCHQYFGGDLAGVLAKLPYLKALGVSVLYLNPIFDSGSAHGYDTHDYLKVSPKFGDKPLLRKLLDEAHRLGMRVIFDFVPNHTGLGFWAFQDVVKRGPRSPYWNWYFIKRWPFVPGDGSAYEGWWGLGSLPKLNTANPGVKRYLIEVTKYWVRFGFDGVRVDMPGDVLNPHAFFKEMRAELKAIKPDAYLVAEIWQRDPSWLRGDEFDSLMNYAIGRDILLRFAKGGSLALYNARRALADLARVYALYPEAVAGMGFNLITSHDTARLLTELGGGGLKDVPSPEARARQRLAAAMLYALPGLPVTFQGDECGFTGERPADPPHELNRYPFQWEKCHGETLAFYQELAGLRRELAALRSAVFRTYFGEGHLLAFFRGEPGEGEVLAAFNNGVEAVTLPLPPGGWRDPLEGRTYRKEVSLPPLGFRYLVHLGR
ncbi:alpha-amylase family glycosyl hydrolase [Thermus scotoductus]|uniref:Pullulan hydrolase type III n=1 Tax=Thermus scotoductus (strain ATCC 700910 / SA-01) TaxID=743525 RepID=E8PPY0_THESS|nr:alpha-amylase family glycosyl hydrolase [Thermus scotoductus]ADW21717.1 pullulan hydrolase type III [Thermus scotoductus SA-01]